MKIGEIISQYREQHHMSMRAFGRKCGVSNAYISILEAGVNPRSGEPLSPTVETYRKISRAMDMSLNDLLNMIQDNENSEITRYTLPERLKARRRELGLTLLQVANHVGVTEATVQRWESGKIKSLHYDNIIKLGNALSMNPSMLMGWEHNDVSPERRKLHDIIDQVPIEQLDLYLVVLSLPTARLQAIVDLFR